MLRLSHWELFFFSLFPNTEVTFMRWVSTLIRAGIRGAILSFNRVHRRHISLAVSEHPTLFFPSPEAGALL